MDHKGLEFCQFEVVSCFISPRVTELNSKIFGNCLALDSANVEKKRLLLISIAFSQILKQELVTAFSENLIILCFIAPKFIRRLDREVYSVGNKSR